MGRSDGSGGHSLRGERGDGSGDHTALAARMATATRSDQISNCGVVTSQGYYKKQQRHIGFVIHAQIE